jgi:hypothetical protein
MLIKIHPLSNIVDRKVNQWEGCRGNYFKRGRHRKIRKRKGNKLGFGYEECEMLP